MDYGKSSASGYTGLCFPGNTNTVNLNLLSCNMDIVSVAVMKRHD